MSTASFTALITDVSALPLYPWFLVRPWTQTAAAPAAAIRFATSGALIESWSHPERIFTVTGTGAWCTRALTSRNSLSGPSAGGPFPLSGYFMHGAGGVQVNHVVRVAGKGFEGLKERVRLTAEQLDAKGLIQGRGPEEIEGLAVLETQGPGIDHLRKREGAAKRPRNKPKGQVAYPGHRGQHKRHREVKAAKGKHASFYRENPASVE